MMYVSMWHNISVEAIGQLLGLDSLLALWDSGIQLQSSNLNSKCLYLLSHLSGPWLFIIDISGCMKPLKMNCAATIYFSDIPSTKPLTNLGHKTLNFHAFHLCHISSIFFYRQDKKF